MSKTTALTLTAATGLALIAFACTSEPAKPLAPVASPAKTAAPAPASAKKFLVSTPDSAVHWTMNAPLEKIYGDVPGGVSGEVFVDPTDIRKTTGLIRVDLSTLELFQQKRDDEKGEYGEKVKNDTQNKHARTWLEISEDTPEETRKQNTMAQLFVTGVTSTGATDLTKLTGETRTVMAQVAGRLVVHGRQTEKQAAVKVSFGFSGDQLTSLRIDSIKPLEIGLEEHDIKPREAFGKLAAKTLAALGNKVASVAPVELEIVARAAP